MADPRLEANKRTVLAFTEVGLNQKDFDAVSELLGPRYVEHNCGVADGREGLKAFLERLKEKSPQFRAETKRMIAEGDLVFAHLHLIPAPGQRGYAAGDIFRFEHGKIVEHWDVVQQIPEDPANHNGMF